MTPIRCKPVQPPGLYPEEDDCFITRTEPIKKVETSFLTEEKTEIPVAFYPHEALAEVCLDGQYMLLSQYRTASGYGYKNTILDLRGKGKEATLTRSTDGKTFQLTEKD